MKRKFTKAQQRRLDAIAERVGQAYGVRWFAPKKSIFGERHVRENPHRWDGMGYQFIAAVPSHLVGTQQFIGNSLQDVRFLLTLLGQSVPRRGAS